MACRQFDFQTSCANEERGAGHRHASCIRHSLETYVRSRREEYEADTEVGGEKYIFAQQAGAADTWSFSCSLSHTSPDIEIHRGNF
jgi:hypothetical protein